MLELLRPSFAPMLELLRPSFAPMLELLRLSFAPMLESLRLSFALLFIALVAPTFVVALKVYVPTVRSERLLTSIRANPRLINPDHLWNLPIQAEEKKKSDSVIRECDITGVVCCRLPQLHIAALSASLFTFGEPCLSFRYTAGKPTSKYLCYCHSDEVVA